MAKKYKAAIIGLGNVAWKYESSGNNEFAMTHADAYLQNSETEIAVVCSPEKDDREGFSESYGVEVFETVDQMLAETSFDIVSICSPAEFHFEHTVKCLEAGVPMVWLEKPPSLNISEIETLIEKQMALKSTVLVNYQRRYCDYYRQLKDLCYNKKLGEIEHINATYSRGLEQNGTHMIDTVLYLLGDETQLSVENVIAGGDKENPSFTLKPLDGFNISFTGMSLPYHCIDITVTCQEGRASVLYGGAEARLEVKTENELFKGFYRLEERKGIFGNNSGLREAMSNALEDLMASHEKGRGAQSNLASAFKSVKIIEEVRKFTENK